MLNRILAYHWKNQWEVFGKKSQVGGIQLDINPHVLRKTETPK